MKKLILAAALIAASTSATTANAEEGMDCEAIEALAKQIMIARQNNMPISRLMSVAGGNPGIESMVVRAYDEPRFSTRDYQQNAINDFANEAASTCYQMQ
jgi:hypothetical protein